LIFEGRKPSDLTRPMIRSILGKPESIDLDFKRTTYQNTGKPEKEWKIELFKDITSFANSNGGYLFIGVEERDNIYANNFLNIDNTIEVARQMYDLCMSHIYEKLIDDELVIEPYLVDTGINIIIARILPGQKKPYMVLFEDNMKFFIRCDNGREGTNRLMTMNEIRDACLSDKVLIKLTDIEKKIDYLNREE
jgi:predicted HTH transcriptional regulator